MFVNKCFFCFSLVKLSGHSESASLRLSDCPMDDDDSEESDLDPQCPNLHCKRGADKGVMDLVYQCPRCYRDESVLSLNPPMSPHGHDANRRERQHKKEIKQANKQMRRAKRVTKEQYEVIQELRRELQSERESTEQQMIFKEHATEDMHTFQRERDEFRQKFYKCKKEKEELEINYNKLEAELKATKSQSGQAQQVQAVQQPINIKTRNDVVEFVMANDSRNLQKKEVQNKVLPMMKYFGIQIIRNYTRLSSTGARCVLSVISNAARSALRAILKCSQYADRRNLKLEFGWIWEMYLAVMNKSTDDWIYRVEEPSVSKKQGGSATLHMNESVSRSDIDGAHRRLFGADDMAYS